MCSYTISKFSDNVVNIENFNIQGFLVFLEGLGAVQPEENPGYIFSVFTKTVNKCFYGRY